MEEVYSLRQIWEACHKAVDEWEILEAAHGHGMADKEMRHGQGNELFTQLRKHLGRGIALRISHEKSEVETT